MLIKEYRITLPMTVEEYQVYNQLILRHWSVSEAEIMESLTFDCRLHNYIQWQRPQKMRLEEAKGLRLETANLLKS